MERRVLEEENMGLKQGNITYTIFDLHLFEGKNQGWSKMAFGLKKIAFFVRKKLFFLTTDQ